MVGVWYPVVGLDARCPVTFNFGAKPFAFDVDRFERDFVSNPEFQPQDVSAPVATEDPEYVCLLFFVLFWVFYL